MRKYNNSLKYKDINYNVYSTNLSNMMEYIYLMSNELNINETNSDSLSNLNKLAIQQLCVIIEDHLNKKFLCLNKKMDIHLFSEDAHFDDGDYTFKLPKIDYSIHKLQIEFCSILCQMYNITHLNNNFTIYDYTGFEININIPIGYYKVDQLIEFLDTELNRKSKQQMFSISKNEISRRIIIEDPNKKIFTLNFPDTSDLNYLLGFQHYRYEMNSKYVSENPIQLETLFDVYFLKIYLNSLDISDVQSSTVHGEHFSYVYSNTLDYKYGLRIKNENVKDVELSNNYEYDETFKIQIYFKNRQKYREFVDFAIKIKIFLN